MSGERLAVREGEGSGTPAATVLGQRCPPDTRGTPAPMDTRGGTPAAQINCHRTPEDPGSGAQATILGPTRGQENGGGGGGGGGQQGTILEDDQQLYDWGIENRLDQYTYQVFCKCTNHKKH